jgi:hypothetical protein
MELKCFDHSKTILREALCIDEVEFDEFRQKQKNFVKKSIKSNKTKTSEIVEEVLQEFSYNELVVMSAKFLKSVVKDVSSENNKLESLIKRLRK